MGRDTHPTMGFLYEAEEWRPVKDYEWWYEVSNMGRVRNRRTKRVLTPKTVNGGNYHVVTLSKKNKARPHRVHVLVLLAFHGPKPPQHGARWRDGDSLNNRASNLLWGTATAEHVPPEQRIKKITRAHSPGIVPIKKVRGNPYTKPDTSPRLKPGTIVQKDDGTELVMTPEGLVPYTEVINLAEQN